MKKDVVKKISIIAAFGMFAFTGMSCASRPQLYDWYDYQKDSYAYVKNADEKSLKSLMETYEKMIKTQKESRAAVPPGIYADYGFLLIKSGKAKEGKEMLQKEVELYPESETFISQYLKKVGKK